MQGLVFASNNSYTEVITYSKFTCYIGTSLYRSGQGHLLTNVFDFLYSDVSYHPDKKIDDDWKWVGNYIKEFEQLGKVYD